MAINSFYFHCRHPKDDAKSYLPCGVSLDIKGPFYLFEKEDRVLSEHMKCFPKLKQVPKFEYFKNYLVKIENEQQRSTYFNNENKFMYKGKLLKEVKSPDEQPSSKYHFNMSYYDIVLLCI